MRMNTPSNDHPPHPHMQTSKPSIAAQANFATDLTVIRSEDRNLRINYELRELRNNEGNIPSSARHRELRVASCLKGSDGNTRNPSRHW